MNNGDVGADLALTGSTDLDISAFSPDRFVNSNTEIGAIK